MNYPAATAIRGVFLRHTWPVGLAIYAAEVATTETVSIAHGTTLAIGRFLIGITSILIAFSYGYAGPATVLSALLGGAPYPATRFRRGLNTLISAGVPMIDALRVIQGAAAVCLFTGSVYVVSQGSPSSVLVWTAGATQGLGLVGGFVGTLLFAPLIDSGVDWYGAFIASAIAGLVLAAVIVLSRRQGGSRQGLVGMPMLAAVRSYRSVLANRQTWLCGVVAALLFAPMTTGGMTWSLAFFKNDLHLGPLGAAMAMGLVAIGWLIGRPLVGWLADHLGHRKRVVFGSGLVMIATIAQVTLWSDLAPPLVSMFVFGVASASTVIPYKLFLEKNFSRDGGRGIATFKGLNLLVLALTGIVFHQVFGPAGTAATMFSNHLHQIGVFWMATIVAAMVLASFLQETDRHAFLKRAA